MCKQMDSIQAVRDATACLQVALEEWDGKAGCAPSHGITRAIRQSYAASPLTPPDMINLVRRLK